MKFQELYNEEQKLLRKLLFVNDPRQQKLIKIRVGWINTMMEKLEERPSQND